MNKLSKIKFLKNYSSFEMMKVKTKKNNMKNIIIKLFI